MNTKELGSIGECVAKTELVKRNIPVLTPIGDYLRYDFVFEYQGKFYKAQVKTCLKSKNGACTFLCVSKKNHTTNKRLSDYVNDVDCFFYYCVDLDALAVIPISELKNNKTFNIRTTPAKTRLKNVHYFQDYTLDKYLATLNSDR